MVRNCNPTLSRSAPFSLMDQTGYFFSTGSLFTASYRVPLKLGDGQPRGRPPAAFFTLVGNPPIVRLVIAFKCQQGAGRRQLPGGFDEFLEIGAAADQAPTEPHAGFFVQVKVGLYGGRALGLKTLNTPPHPTKAHVLDHFDGLLEGLATIGKGGVYADAVEEIRRSDGGCRRALGGQRHPTVVASNRHGRDKSLPGEQRHTAVAPRVPRECRREIVEFMVVPFSFKPV